MVEEKDFQGGRPRGGKYIQGGQNFFELIRKKIRTFSEEIRTIFEKKIRTIRTFFLTNLCIFFKNPYNQ